LSRERTEKRCFASFHAAFFERPQLTSFLGRLRELACIQLLGGVMQGCAVVPMGPFDMALPAPANTLPTMTGAGHFGPIEMGGMFTVIKIREGLAANDYKDPGPYRFPKGIVAYEVDAPRSEAARQNIQKETNKPTGMKGMKGM
jgi:hypothetical protein